jgi:hypothetical protein
MTTSTYAAFASERASRLYKLLERLQPPDGGACPVRGDSRRFGGRFGSEPEAVTPDGTRTESQVMIGMINSATMLATLIIGLIAGPAVSL